MHLQISPKSIKHMWKAHAKRGGCLRVQVPKNGISIKTKLSRNVSQNYEHFFEPQFPRSKLSARYGLNLEVKEVFPSFLDVFVYPCFVFDFERMTGSNRTLSPMTSDSTHPWMSLHFANVQYTPRGRFQSHEPASINIAAPHSHLASQCTSVLRPKSRSLIGQSETGTLFNMIYPDVARTKPHSSDTRANIDPLRRQPWRIRKLKIGRIWTVRLSRGATTVSVYDKYLKMLLPSLLRFRIVFLSSVLLWLVFLLLIFLVDLCCQSFCDLILVFHDGVFLCWLGVVGCV
jgi:hypothetical protein